ncbi:MAG: SUF system NifU family Fe-S cluster assembly protein [Dehalococcoidia bacterium]
MTPAKEDEYAKQEAQLDDLYREVILDHYRNPRHRGSLPSPTISREGYNPLCGDEVTLDVTVRDNLVEEVAFRGSGCSISQSSASMMVEAITGKTVQQAESLFKGFTAMMQGSEAVDPELLGDLEALEGVRKFPVRVKCATLAWHTLREALEALDQDEG